MTYFNSNRYHKEQRTREYAEYLQSDYWKRARKRRLQIDKCVCQMCGGNATEVHHMTYRHIFGELGVNEYGQSVVDTDLVSLCHDCHEKITHLMEYRITNSRTGKRGWKDVSDVPAINEYLLNERAKNQVQRIHSHDKKEYKD